MFRVFLEVTLLSFKVYPPLFSLPTYGSALVMFPKSSISSTETSLAGMLKNTILFQGLTRKVMTTPLTEGPMLSSPSPNRLYQLVHWRCWLVSEVTPNRPTKKPKILGIFDLLAFILESETRTE
ncbi:hypothetical protein AQUCO_01300007v1 [Aquilegia coerulea]|uniref:Uncharacterized protein n=1 Tax=Aquilegia coerulea TaxID=218851 RepID=A0A2G5DZ19_AQUCA|nr:hypothetical protein AQUCO_01300007v1 [Aquilegia coerulea]